MTLTTQLIEKLDDSLKKSGIDSDSLGYEQLRRLMQQQLSIVSMLEWMGNESMKGSGKNLNDEYKISLDILDEISSNKDFVNEVMKQSVLLSKKVNTDRFFSTNDLKELYKKMT